MSTTLILEIPIKIDAISGVSTKLKLFENIPVATGILTILYKNEKKRFCFIILKLFLEVLKKYLPAQLSSEEIKKFVEESIAKIKAEMKDPSASSGQVMGKVMADLNPKIKAKADGGEVSKIVKELLSK